MTQRRERSFIGKIVLGVFVLFNLFNLWLLSSTINMTSDRLDTTSNGFDRNIAIFLGAGVGFVEVAIWLVGGAILGVLVLLTRGKVVDRP